ncbi:MAG: hypothetical protein PHQ05_08275 [Sterolibacterium sp.]|nr:hypothetical protein [Sterolibacterium sp.]
MSMTSCAVIISPVSAFIKNAVITGILKLNKISALNGWLYPTNQWPYPNLRGQAQRPKSTKASGIRIGILKESQMNLIITMAAKPIAMFGSSARLAPNLCDRLPRQIIR